MKESVLEAQQRFESQIDRLRMSDRDKEKMKRVIKGILDSSRGRLFTKRENDYEEYLTMRPRDEFEYELCVIKRMVNEYSGATENRIKTPIGLMQALKYVNEHEDIIESELIDAENYQRRLKAQSSESKEDAQKPKTPEEDFKDTFITTIESLPNRTDSQKQRAIDVLEAIAVVPQNRLYTKREDGYSEAIALRGEKDEIRYYIVKRWSDYAGATIGREYDPIGVKGLIDYVEENKISVDKELKDLRKKFPELEPKKPEASTQGAEFDDR